MDYLVDIYTKKASVIKLLIDALKEFVAEVYLQFNEDGIVLHSTDTMNSIIIDMKLESNKFDSYHVSSEHNYAEISLIDMNKLLKVVEKNNELRIIRTRPRSEIISFHVINPQTEETTILDLHTIHIIDHSSNHTETQMTFLSVFQLPCVTLQKFINNMSAINDKICVIRNESEINFSCSGTSMKIQRIWNQNSKNFMFKLNADPGVIIHYEFFLYRVKQIMKCSPLCEFVEIGLEKDNGIIFKYNIENLGSITIFLFREERDPF